MTLYWLTLCGEFLSIWSIWAVWSVTLVCLVICSSESVKQNSKYDLVSWGTYLLIVFCIFLSENLFILRLKIYINVTKKIAFLGLRDISNVRSMQFAKSYLSGGLYKIPIRNGFDLGRKISIKILSVLILCINSKNRLPIIWN